MKRTALLLALLAATANAQYSPPNGSNVYQPGTRYSTYTYPDGSSTTRGDDGSRYSTYTYPDGSATTRGQDADGRDVRCTTYTYPDGSSTTRCN